VLVADETYPETLTVSGGTVLRALDASAPKPEIDSPSATEPAVTTTGSSGGSIDGFQISSPYLPVRVFGPGNIAYNHIPTTTVPTAGTDIQLNGVVGAVAITGNNLTDDGLGIQTGVIALATTSTNLTVQDNDLSGFSFAIWLQSGSGPATIADNHITGAHDGNGVGIEVYEGAPVIRHNLIEAPGGGTTTGVRMSDTNGPSGATMSRNTITGMDTALQVGDTSLPVTLNGDLFAGNTFHGVRATEPPADLGHGDVTATNVTAFDNLDADFYLDRTALTLDSSIVDDIARVGSATCSISFSRGFALVSPGDLTDCNDFQSIADPMFVGGADYHLLSSSPMIDAGNPAAPGAGVLDIDGDARAIAPNPGCSGAPSRRDIGADEYSVVIVPPCAPPTPGPSTTTPKKKCKKGQKLKKGKCVKKKRKKKRDKR
jgi:hypothetical protein